MDVLQILQDKRIIAILIVTLIFCIVVGFLPTDFQTGPEKPLFTMFGMPISYWRFSHLFLHMLFGFWFPRNIMFFFILGIMWEVTEMTMGKIYGQKYWHGTLADVIINLIGFIIGASIKLNIT